MNFNFKAFVASFVGDRKLEGVRYYIGQIKPKDGGEKPILGLGGFRTFTLRTNVKFRSPITSGFIELGLTRSPKI